MKKTFALFAILGLMVIGVSGCGGAADNTTSAPKKIERPPEDTEEQKNDPNRKKTAGGQAFTENAPEAP